MKKDSTPEGREMTVRERLQAAWDSYEPETDPLPPIDFTDAEAEHLAHAFTPEPRP